MAKITPFNGLRPTSALASQVATLPYDVCSVAEARQYKDNPNHFYHVTRSEIDLPEDIDVHDQIVYNKAAENLQRMVSDGILVKDESPCYYIYKLVMNGRAQTGLLCGSSIDDYNNGIVKKHEFTRPEKELDRINHIKTTKAQTGIVFLAYKDVADMNALVASIAASQAPAYDFIAEDGVQHTVWVIAHEPTVQQITQIFEQQVPATYIADGHHRAASAAKVAEYFKENNGAEPNADAPYNYFLTCIFPESQLAILDYNRVVKDLNGLTVAEFLKALENDFEVSEGGAAAIKPSETHEFGAYVDGKWYRLKAKEGSFTTDPIGVLDVSILQNNILSKILNINDPRVDTRVEFVGGIRGLAELERRVNSGNMVAAFSCYPVSIQQLFDVADSGDVMPPKSTWFEPKTRDGLVVYTF